MSTISSLTKVTLIGFFAIVFFSITGIAFAQTGYQPLTGLPGVTSGNASLAEYINTLFLVSISLGAMLAVIKISLAGFSYMMSDVITKKGQAIEDIQEALLGLAILLATVTVLYVINPNLVSLNILGNAKPVTIQPAPGPANNTATCQNGTITVTLANGQSSTGCADSAPGEFTPVAGVEWQSINKDAVFNEMVARCGAPCSNYTFSGQYPGAYDIATPHPSGADWGDVIGTLKSKCSGSVTEEVNDTLKVARYYCYKKI